MRPNFIISVIAVLIVSSLFGPAVSAGTTYKIEGTSGKDYISDQLILTMKEGVRLDPIQSNTNSTGIQSIDRIVTEQGVVSIAPFYPNRLKNEILRRLAQRLFVVQLGKSGDLIWALNAFAGDPNVEFADPNYIRHLDYIPNDPMIDNWYQLSRIDTYGAWDFARGDSTRRIILGIVDSGVYYDHPDLEPNMWINGPEDIDGDGRFTDADINGIDDDENGYNDDVVGYDITMHDPDPQEPTPTHGTHVAGCATMACDNNYGGAATGWGTRIMAVKCARDDQPEYIYNGYVGIMYAAENHCSVINLSWGGTGYAGYEQSILTQVYEAGVLVIAAAGNESSSSPHYPAGYQHVVAVVATGETDRIASFSNYGTWVDICAPGEAIMSTWSHNSFMPLYGTSMASPIVSGVACLLRGCDTTMTVDSAISRLLATSDNIDDLNPGYGGLLGSGRVNAARAIGEGRFPRLQLSNYQVTLTSDDGDSLLNPGEGFNATVILSNAWENASNVTGILRSDGQFNVADSTAEFGTIPGNGGQGNNGGSPFNVIVNRDVTIGSHQFRLHIITGNGPTFDFTFNVNVTLEKRGFPVSIPGNIEAAPLVFDFDRDGAKEIIAGAGDGNYYAIEADGSNSPGWPRPTSGEAPGGPAIGDIDNDQAYEVVGMTRDGNIYAWRTNGDLMPGFPFHDSLMFAAPVLADIDGNSDLEIMFGGFLSKKFHVLNHDGTEYPNWPYQGSAFFWSGAAVADIDHDALPEIICGDYDSTLHVWNADKSNVLNFPIRLSGQVKSSPAVADIDGDGNLNIIIGVSSGDLYAINSDGTIVPGWPVRLGGAILSAPSLSDIDNDGHLEIAAGCNNGAMYVFRANGQPFNGFPIVTDGPVQASAVIGDIDADGYPDIVFGSADGYLYAFNYQRELLRNFPIRTISLGQITGTSALADLDGDGDCDIVTGVKTGGNNLEVIDYKIQLSSFAFTWPFYGKDIHHSGYYGPFVTGVGETETLPQDFGLTQNYPNPFNSNTVISFSIPVAGKVDIAIYDLLGRRVRSLYGQSADAGDHDIIWDGADDSGKPVSSGIYLYQIHSSNVNMTRKMTLLR